MKKPLWRERQRENFTSIEELVDFLELSLQKKKSVLARSSFPLNLPKRLAEKIEKNSLTDPLFLQFVPQKKEEEDLLFTSLDPTQDQVFRKEKRLLKKYKSRALLLVCSACALHCRFCFRKHFPHQKGEDSFLEEMRLIEKDKTIDEVILSGGDPLSLDNKLLSNLFHSLEKIPHLKRVRLHTRFPIGIPERIDKGLLDLFGSTRLQIIVVLHVNHPKELDENLFSYLKPLQQLAIPLLTQSVLLKGVNDSLDTLKELFLTLVDHGVLPYYLHLIDPVKGSSHFKVEEKRGIQLLKKLQEELPGYALPRFVKEIPFQKSKSLIL